MVRSSSGGGLLCAPGLRPGLKEGSLAGGPMRRTAQANSRPRICRRRKILNLKLRLRLRSGPLADGEADGVLNVSTKAAARRQRGQHWPSPGLEIGGRGHGALGLSLHLRLRGRGGGGKEAALLQPAPLLLHDPPRTEHGDLLGPFGWRCCSSLLLWTCRCLTLRLVQNVLVVVGAAVVTLCRSLAGVHGFRLCGELLGCLMLQGRGRVCNDYDRCLCVAGQREHRSFQALGPARDSQHKVGL
mmetsp:Transcript_18054/g.52588  ORF Transcript_18054/g.52588 Transcript_18054/m.52588 type:complete len:243 (+) Transcript_18054:428-1156(+)